MNKIKPVRIKKDWINRVKDQVYDDSFIGFPLRLDEMYFNKWIGSNDRWFRGRILEEEYKNAVVNDTISKLKEMNKDD